MTIHKTDMLKTLWATVRQGKIELLESDVWDALQNHKEEYEQVMTLV